MPYDPFGRDAALKGTPAALAFLERRPGARIEASGRRARIDTDARWVATAS